ncbi:hypothetical protein QQS21_010639 [Conoideocrella luteorostrata]|uniref:Cupin type-2 domain-containing protein n=1 Tax=Conoideocrella luteorostrata TaxID=1105319 RepID=A0AAJ0CES2_9HYPO|nr:hypothetical protein QQS21_010639 [Conoideocrella luteorostrata]
MPLPPARLIRTSHNKDCQSVFAADALLPAFFPFGPSGSSFTVFDTRPSIPVDNTAPVPSHDNTLPRCPPSGAIFSISDIAAGAVAPMHRTRSIDYGVVLTGEIVLRLDGGEEKTARAGDMIVQQGTNHQWVNMGEATCRILFVMLAADAIVTDAGEALEETVFKK